MTIDTRQKRFSMLNHSWLPRITLFEADGVVDADDRVQVLNLYSGHFDVGAAVTDIFLNSSVPNRTGYKNSMFSLDIDAYFSGTERPFTYALQAGTLPAGLSLNTSSGVISGTPTTVETQAGIVIRGTDQTPNIADTNSFTITVEAALGSLVDMKFDALRVAGYTGGMSDMTLQWLQANGATANQINDAWMEMLASKGQTTGSINDRWFALLGSLGHTGSFSDREYSFWLGGGSFV